MPDTIRTQFLASTFRISSLYYWLMHAINFQYKNQISKCSFYHLFSFIFLLYTSFLPWRITATLLAYCPILCLYSYCLFAWHPLPMPSPSHHLPTFSFVFVSPAYHTAWHIIGPQDCVEWIKACRHIKYYMLCYILYYFILYTYIYYGPLRFSRIQSYQARNKFGVENWEKI